MSCLGMIVRADQGGLGNQTRAIAEHLKPERVLVIDMQRDTRGKQDLNEALDLGIEGEVVTQYIGPEPLSRFLDGLDRVFSVETFYTPDMDWLAREHKVERVLYMNPELYSGREDQSAEHLYIAAPCVGGVQVLPQPVDTHRAHYRQRGHGPVTFLHVQAPAMLDRNGTETFKKAQTILASRDQKIVTCAAGHGSGYEPDDWPEIYDEADMLVLPRRYGCLSLPLLEAAASGVPSLMPDLPPQNEILPRSQLLRVTQSEPVAMKAGPWQVATIDPGDLAARMWGFATSRERVRDASDRARAWAETQSWDALGGAWEVALRGASG